MRAVFGGTGDWLSGAGFFGLLSRVVVFFPALAAEVFVNRQRCPAVDAEVYRIKSNNLNIS